MTDRDRIAELEAEVARLRGRAELASATDDALEAALRDRLPLEVAIGHLFEVLLRHTGAASALVHTFDETLELHDFASGPPFPVTSGAMRAVTDRGAPFLSRGESQTVVGQRIDVAGELFGVAALCFDGSLDDVAAEEARALLDTWTEALDNFLASIARARQVALLTSDLAAALREPVLDVGIDRAIEVLGSSVAFDNLMLVYRHEDDTRGASLRYLIIQDGERTHDSSAPADMEVDEFIRTRAPSMIRGDSRDLLDRFGITRCREEVLIAGISDATVVGRVVVTSARGEFNTFDRDLVGRFADYLRLRIVDYNREWRHLSRIFPSDVVRRLVSEAGYEERFLAPVEREVAILFCDISGFTRVSEQVLKEPALIGELIDTWSARVVDIVWETGGVFDKMVGDCVIGLWGPPFFDDDARSLCHRAADAARRIRDFTASLSDGAILPALRGLEPPIGVATGLNYCPLFVGRFGPDEDYTGFSSGMNNTARLQGVATRDQILCMEGFVEAYGDPAAFGEEESAKVKNVAEPLRYRRLL